MDGYLLYYQRFIIVACRYLAICCTVPGLRVTIGNVYSVYIVPPTKRSKRYMYTLGSWENKDKVLSDSKPI